MTYIHVGRVATIVDEKKDRANFLPASGVTILLEEELERTVDAALSGLPSYSIEELEELEEKRLNLETRGEDDHYFDAYDVANALRDADLVEHYASHQVLYAADMIAVWSANMNEVDEALFGRHGDMGSFNSIMSAISEGVSAFINDASEESLRETLESIADAVEEYED